MSTTLFNPTNETFEMVYAGKTIYLDAGGKIKVDDVCGAHLLDRFSSRGLCSLDHGDDINAVAKEGLKRNHEFKKRMITAYNHTNAVRKSQGLPYLEPSDYLVRASIDLGIDLDQPYVSTNPDNTRVAELQEQVNELKQLVSTLVGIHDEVQDGPPSKSKAVKNVHV